jgi:hypothetical protein
MAGRRFRKAAGRRFDRNRFFINIENRALSSAYAGRITEKYNRIEKE